MIGKIAEPLRLSLATVLGLTGLLILISEPIKALPTGHNLIVQSVDLQEAEELGQESFNLYLQGKYGEAIAVAEEALAIKEKVYGQETLTILDNLNFLADLYQLQKNYERAETLYQRVLSINEKAYGKEHPAIVKSLYALAKLYENHLFNYKQAEVLYQRALAIYEKAHGQEDPLLLDSLRNLAALYETQIIYPQAETLYRRALVIAEKTYGEEDYNLVWKLVDLARIYTYQHKYAQAEILYQRALAITEKNYGKEHYSVAQLLYSWAKLYDIQGDYLQAEALYQQAISINEKAYGKGHPAILDSLYILARFYENHLDASQAEVLYQRALAITEKNYEEERSANLRTSPITSFFHASKFISSLSSLANFYKNQGDYIQAETLYQRSLAITKETYGKESPAVLDHLDALKSIYLAQDKYVQAETLYQRILDITEKTYGQENRVFLDRLDSLARLYREQQKYAQAEILYQQSLDIAKKVYGQENRFFLDRLNSLAKLYEEQQKYAQAETLYQQSLAIAEKVYGKEDPAIIGALNRLASVLQSQSKYTQAEALYQQALSIHKEADRGKGLNVASALSNLAWLYLAEGDIVRGIDYLTRSMNIEEDQLAYFLARNNLTVVSNSFWHYFAMSVFYSPLTSRIISFHLQGASNNPQAARLATTTVLRRKGRLLDALIQNHQHIRQTLTPESRALLDELTATYSQVTALDLNPPQERWQVRHSELYAKAMNLVKALYSSIPEFSGQSQSVMIEAVQQQIPHNAALVELVKYEPKATESEVQSPRYAAYILFSEGDPKWIDLGDAEAINRDLDYYSICIRDLETPIFQLKQAARALDEKLMRPIRKMLGDTRLVLISPDSKLNLIPFESLVDENNHYLVETYSFTYLSSGRDLLLPSRSTSSQQPPLLIADSDFTLPETRKEAEAIARLLRVEPLMGRKATEAAIKQVRGPQVLHVATHGFFRTLRISRLTDNPAHPFVKALLNSGLLLGEFNQTHEETKEDGVLTGLEISTLDLNGTKLVVLSGCDTGLGNIVAGDGFPGLRRALSTAGAESQVISLWQVADTATKDLMEAYYQRLLAGEGRSEALRQAKLEMLGSQDYQHPYYWASFIPSGAWTPMEFATAR